MESMPAPESAVTVGVDPHLDTHVAAVIDQAGRLCGTQALPASTRGYVALVTWAERLERWSGSAWKAPAPPGPGWPACPRLRPPGGGGQPARPQHPPPPRHVGSDPRPGRRPGHPGWGGRHHPQDPRRPGGDDPGPAGGPPRRPQSPGAAAEQLHGVLSSAPEALRQPLPGLKTNALVNACAAMPPGPSPARPPPPRPRCGPWLGAGSNSKANSTTSTLNSRRSSPRPRPPGRAVWGRVDTAGQLLVTAGITPSGSAPRPPSRICAGCHRSRRPRAAPTATG
jgi:hypothetical protein